MSSLRLRLLEAQMRRFARPRLARTADVPTARRDFEIAARIFFRPPPFALHLRRAAGSDWIACGRTCRRGVVLYIHGGAFIAGSPDTHSAMLARLSLHAGVGIAAPRYRLAPEHPLPAAHEDARAAWDWLLGLGYAPSQIALGGDSAGGGIALSLLSELCRAGTPPACAFALSPWTDLALTGASLRRNAQADPLLPVARIDEVRDYALGAEQSPDDPRVSPLYAAFPDCPPVRLDWAATEILRDDSVRMAALLRRCGAAVCAVEAPRGPHVWPLFAGWIPEADATLRAVARFIQSALPDSSL